MIKHILGFPSIGGKRELKTAIESYWKGASTLRELELACAKIQNANWQIQKHAGLDLVATGDFSLYDRMLDTSAMLGIVPSRFNLPVDGEIGLEDYFKLARGDKDANIAAMEMTKWFNTNYHYIVPEISKDTAPSLRSKRVIYDTIEATVNGYEAKACLIGPITYLSLAKSMDGSNRWEKLGAICDVYEKVLKFLSMSCGNIQIEEPVLCADMEPEAVKNFPIAMKRLRSAAGGAKIILATYFDSLDDNLNLALESGCDFLHIDAVRGKACLQNVAASLPQTMGLSVGIVDGRNIWKNNYAESVEILEGVKNKIGENRLWVASSCSLLHSPVDLRNEIALSDEIKNWMAFAVQKCSEISVISAAVRGVDVKADLLENAAAVESRKKSGLIHDDAVKRRLDSVDAAMYARKSAYPQRKKAQAWLNLPLLPTTTIGSFPQTPDIRKARRAMKNGDISADAYEAFMKNEIAAVVEKQEELNLDVLVHGEPERNDMVEYFGEQLKGFCFTENGWVQSYGTRCVKPPVIFGDISRPEPMTLKWINYAASLTKKPMKGMLTGPVTILCWSFVRDDMARENVCRQIALAIRDEVADLEKSGIKIIQIDEAALSEGMPIKGRDKAAYLKWAVDSFRLASSCVDDSTQIHTHMCYSEFNSIIKAIAEMDADVISIESSRSKMELLEVFKDFEYPNEIGPGVYDIHSPRIPTAEEMAGLLEKALKYIPKERLWVNPDCGLKTRTWKEVTPSLKNMVEAARIVRRGR